MRVKIINPRSWYDGQKGATFNVMSLDDNTYIMSGSINFEIHKSDCEILPDETTQPEPFDLERALKGEKVICRNGEIVDEIYHIKSLRCKFNVYSVIDGEGTWHLENGSVLTTSTSIHDLFMAPKEPKVVTKWAVVCQDHHGVMFTFGALKDTKEEAINLGHGKVFFICISPIQITLP